jgi:hypothetical protein
VDAALAPGVSKRRSEAAGHEEPLGLELARLLPLRGDGVTLRTEPIDQDLYLEVMDALGREATIALDV